MNCDADIIRLPAANGDLGTAVCDKSSGKYVYTLKQNGILVGGHQLTEWTNHAEDIHKSIVGEEVYQTKLQRQFQVKIITESKYVVIDADG